MVFVRLFQNLYGEGLLKLTWNSRMLFIIILASVHLLPSICIDIGISNVVMNNIIQAEMAEALLYLETTFLSRTLNITTFFEP